MKHLLLLIVFLLVSFSTFSQNKISDNKIKNADIINLLSSVDSLSFKKTPQLYAIFYTVNNGSGSAKAAESDESSDSIYISLSEYDEYPKKNLFKIGPFVRPFLLKESLKNSNNIIIIEHGPYNNRIKTAVSYSIDSLNY